MSNCTETPSCPTEATLPCPPEVDLSCVPVTIGAPTWTPQPDQIPFALDMSNGGVTLWVHSCQQGWLALAAPEICELMGDPPVSPTQICYT